MADISQALGDFMLKGYVLTDQSCPTPGCAIPMLRSPRGKSQAITFCVKCGHGGSPSASTVQTPSSQGSPVSRLSRPSTPPTEVSETQGSNYSDFELPPETDGMRERREQSDRASSEIGKRLLQGWTMLGDECPSANCYGVPLVRPPRATVAADFIKECVICGTRYKTESDWVGSESLVPCSGTAPDPRNSSSLRTQSLDSEIFTKDKNHNKEPQLKRTAGKDVETLDNASEALQISLQALSSQLRKLSSRTHLDPDAIGITADAIGKVTQVLSQLRGLEYNTSMAMGKLSLLDPSFVTGTHCSLVSGVHDHLDSTAHLMPSPLTFLKTLTTSNHKDNGVPTKGILRRNPAKLKKSIRRSPADQDHPEPGKKVVHIPAPNSPIDEHDEEHGDYEFHSSIPNGSMEGWRHFPPPHRVDTIMMKGGRPASHPRQSEALSENPIVSRYITTLQTEHPATNIPDPMPPSRTWSTIRSVPRERQTSTKNEGTATAHASLAPNIPHSRNPDEFSLLTVGQQSSEHERRYIEYPTRSPSAKRANLTFPSSQLQRDKNTSLPRNNTVISRPAIKRQPAIQRDFGSNYNADSDPEVYHYIVPAGVDVIFQDEDGTEITRTGETVRTPVRNGPLKSAPIIVHDEFGTFLYQDTLPAGPRESSRRQARDKEGLSKSYPLRFAHLFSTRNTRNENWSSRNKGPHGRIGTETNLPSWILSSPASLSPRSKIVKIDREGNQTLLNQGQDINGLTDV